MNCREVLDWVCFLNVFTQHQLYFRELGLIKTKGNTLKMQLPLQGFFIKTVLFFSTAIWVQENSAANISFFSIKGIISLIVHTCLSLFHTHLRATSVTLIITLSQPKWSSEVWLVVTWTVCERVKNPSLNLFRNLIVSLLLLGFY